MIMTVFGLLGIPFVTDLLKDAGTLGYQKLKDINEFHKFLASYDIEKPKDEDKSLYIHTLLLFESRINQSDFSHILIKDASFSIFKNSYIHSKDKNPFLWHVNNELMKSQDGRTDTSWNELIVQKILEDFFATYDILVRQVATPVQSEMLNSIADLKEQSHQQTTVILERIQALNDDSPIVKEQIKYANAFIENKQFTLALDSLLILENNFHSIRSTDHKSTVLTNIGHSYFELGKQDEAHSYFKKAYEINTENYAALCNYSQVLLHQNDYIKANQLIEKAIQLFGEKNPEIWEVYIIIKKQSLAIDEILKMVPKEFTDEPKVKRAISLAYRDQNHFKDYYRTVKEVFEVASDTEIIKITYIECVIHRYQSDYRIFNIRSINKELTEEIECHLKLILDLLASEKEATKSKLFLQQARIILLYLLRKEQDAINILKELESEYSLEYQKLYRLKAMIHFILKDFNGALATLDQYFLMFNEVEDNLMLIEISSQANRVGKLEDYYEKLISREGNVFLNQATNFIVDRYIKNEDTEKLTYWQSKIKEYIGLDFRLIEARILLHLQSPDLPDLLSECYEQINDETRFSLIYQLSELYEETNYFEKGVELLEKRIITFDYDTITDNLIRLIEKSGDSFKLIELLGRLRDSRGIHPKYTIMECNVYSSNYQYEKAISIAEQYLAVYPERIDINVFIISLYFKTQNFEQLDRYLNSKLDYELLNFDDFNNYLAILAYRGRMTDCIDILYEYHRKYNNPKSNDLYLTFCLKFDVFSHLPTPTLISEGTYVVLYDGIRERMDLLFENRSVSDLIRSKSEVSIDEELYKLLAGKQVGFELVLPNGFMEKKWAVESISNKYLQQFKQCQADASGIFKREGAVKAFHIDDLVNFIKAAGLEQKSQDSPFDIALSYYTRAEVGLGLLSEALNENPIKIRDIIRQKGHKLIASHGFFKESILSEEIDFKNDIVLDICGVLTLFDLNLLEIVSSEFDKLTITHTTYDLIYEHLQQNIYNITDGETLNNSPLLEAVNKYLTIESPNTLKLNKNEKERLYKEFGRSFYDSALLAQEKEAVLLSDDLVFRKQTTRLMNSVELVWIIPLLKHLKEDKAIEDEIYHDCLIKLIEQKYSFISINEHTLLHCLKCDGYIVTDRFIALTKMLSGIVSTTESATHTMFKFFHLLIILRNLIPEELVSISMVVLCSLSTERNLNEVIDSYETIMEKYNGIPHLYKFLKLMLFKFRRLYNF